MTLDRKLSVFEFGRQLIETQDLDPVYVILANARTRAADGVGSEWSYQKMDRWLLAYWCFYHVGTASWIVDQPSYWTAVMAAAASKDWPRSSERRHFRGEKAIKSVTYLEQHDVNLDQFRHAGRAFTLQEVMYEVMKWEGFGEWIAFKVADMLERLGIARVSFKPSDVFAMYEAPREGAMLMAEHNQEKFHLARIARHGALEPEIAYGLLTTDLKLSKMKAPPRYERPLNIQEIETILCKWKSHMNGHYEVGKDTHEIREGLLRFSKCKTSQELLRAGKVGKLW